MFSDKSKIGYGDILARKRKYRVRFNPWASHESIGIPLE
jgi:hypothetical protein